MAPKKNVKRSAQEIKAAPPVPKKPKVDPTMTGVIEAIEQATDLSDSCRQMLLAFLPGSLGVPSDQRHAMQQSAVDMIGEALVEVEASLQASVDKQKASVIDVESTKNELDGKVVTAEAQLRDTIQFQESKNTELVEAERSTLSATETLAAAKETQRTGDAEVVAVKERKLALDNGVDVDWKAIMTGGLEETQAEAHYKALIPVVKSLALDDSLMTALPAACTRQLAERGAFDKMVLDQLEKSLADKAAELQKMLDESAAAVAERAGAVATAEAELEAAKTKQKEAADELVKAQSASAEASSVVEAAKAAVTEFLPEYQKATAARDACVEKMNGFKDYNLLCFHTLKTRITTPVVPVATSPAKQSDEVASSEKGEMQVEASPAKAVEVGGA